MKLLGAPMGSLKFEVLIRDDEEEYHEGRYTWRSKRARIPLAIR